MAKEGFPVHFSCRKRTLLRPKFTKILSYVLISTCMQVTAKYLLVRKSVRKIP